MRIVIDMASSSKSESHDGRDVWASLAFVKALVEHRAGHEVFVVVSDSTAGRSESVRRSLVGTLPPENVVYWTPVEHAALALEAPVAKLVGRRVRSTFLSDLRADAVLVLDISAVVRENVSLLGEIQFPALTAVVVRDEDFGAYSHALAPCEPPDGAIAFDLQPRIELVLATSQHARSRSIQELSFAERSVVDLAEIESADLDSAATITVEAIGRVWAERRSSVVDYASSLIGRPRMAFVSPLPPERSGISDYSADLLPELHRYYEIDIIVDQPSVSAAWVAENCRIRTVQWFLEHAHIYDRVLYQFGNSPFHSHMFEMLRCIPGVVVLHDFYLSGVVSHLDKQGRYPGKWLQELYHSHGYFAVRENIAKGERTEVVAKYPCNKSVVDAAIGIIVHSEASRAMSSSGKGYLEQRNWAVLPLARTCASLGERPNARRRLGIPEGSLVVCSFGLLAPTKQSRKLLDAWLMTEMSRDSHVFLCFVGENHGGQYGRDMLECIEDSHASDRVRITGWADRSVYTDYMLSADIAVQLRTDSRGETSAAVLDCLNFGIATIVNRHGSMRELPAECVYQLPDEFNDSMLIDALLRLAADANWRGDLGSAGRNMVMTRNSPRECSEKYVDAIESWYAESRFSRGSALNGIAADVGQCIDGPGWAGILELLSNNRAPSPFKVMFVDVSGMIGIDLGTGVQRVVKEILGAFFGNALTGFRIEPVYASEESCGYRYARSFTMRFLGGNGTELRDELINFNNGDVFIGLDLQQSIVCKQRGAFAAMRAKGVKVAFVVYDLLPVLRPDVFPEGVNLVHAAYLDVVSENDVAVCISRSVANEFGAWIKGRGQDERARCRVEWFRLGSDKHESKPSVKVPVNARELLLRLKSRPTFLMVGTVEPRKGYLQTLASFEGVWAAGCDVNLVIVGKEGWLGLPDGSRRTIPWIVEAIRSSSQWNVRLFWLNDVSDDYLSEIYQSSACLVAASEGEGFGLPLLEASLYGVPIICRDIPVFREVCGESATYFSGNSPASMIKCIRDWLDSPRTGISGRRTAIPVVSWEESSRQLLQALAH